MLIKLCAFYPYMYLISVKYEHFGSKTCDPSHVFRSLDHMWYRTSRSLNLWCGKDLKVLLLQLFDYTRVWVPDICPGLHGEYSSRARLESSKVNPNQACDPLLYPASPLDTKSGSRINITWLHFENKLHFLLTKQIKCIILFNPHSIMN